VDIERTREMQNGRDKFTYEEICFEMEKAQLKSIRGHM
jgi:hypothetical protein